MIHASVLYYSSIRGNRLPPDQARGAPLCMTQYGRFFATYRKPCLDRDEIHTFTDSRHIVVICRNQFFSVTVMEENFTPLPQATLARSLQEIKRLSMEYEAIDTAWKYPVGCLTSLPRDEWAKARQALEADRANSETLGAIDSALLVVALDDEEPHDLTEACEVLLHNGDGTNRWFDKNTLIISGNGKAGVCMEHSAIDGHTMLSYLDFMYSYAKERAHEKIPSSYYTPSAVKPLQWRLSPSLKDTVFEARVGFKRLAQSVQVRVVEMEGVGEDVVRNMGLTGDPFLQQAFQVALYRMRRRNGEVFPSSTYESCQTKAYFHGRTECIRAVTPQSHALAMAMSSTTPQSPEELVSLLKAACAAHRDRTRECSVGMGVDRHLFALKNLAVAKRRRLPGYIMPAIFEDPLYSRLMTSVLSTSNCGSKAVSVFTFGPVVDEGLGLGYVITPNALQVSVTSFKGEANTYAKLLHEAILDLKAILEGTHKAKL